MKLRQGRRVPEHIYLQANDEPADSDRPLFTAPSADLADLITYSVNYVLANVPMLQVELDERIASSLIGRPR